MAYKRTLTAAGWAVAGLFISIQIIKSGHTSLFGYPLLVLSILLIGFALKYMVNKQ